MALWVSPDIQPDASSASHHAFKLHQQLYYTRRRHHALGIRVVRGRNKKNGCIKPIQPTLSNSIFKSTQMCWSRGRKNYYQWPRVSASDEEVWVSQCAFEQGDRMAYICSVASLSEIWRAIKNSCNKISPPTPREKINDLCKPWRIVPQDGMDFRFQRAILE